MGVTGKSWLDRVVDVTSVAAAAALLLMMLTTVADVVMANLFRHPILGAYDMVETMLVFAVFLGMPRIFVANANIVVDIIDFFVSARVVVRLKQLALLLSLLFLVLLLWNMVTPALDAYGFGEKKQELGLPLWILWLPMLLGVLLSAVAILISLVSGTDDRTDRKR
jgi:TRAP-type transport system small permease protein